MSAAAYQPVLRRPRQPLAGLATAAVAGILLAEAARHWLLAARWENNPLAWIADGLFLTLAVAFFVRPRAWKFWLAAVVGFAALHFFQTSPPAPGALAQVLALPDAAGRVVHVTHVTGRVDGPPRRLPERDDTPGTNATASWRFVLAAESLALDGLPQAGGVRVATTWHDGPPTLADGDELTLTGLAGNLQGPRNPGEFDLAAWQARRGIYSELRIDGLADGRVTRSPGAGWLAALAARVHDGIEHTLRTDLEDDPEAGAVVTTMLLGLRDDPGLGELTDAFQRTGTLHYFAIDGLKLGLVGAVLLQALATLGLPRTLAGLLTLPVLGVYALATGLGPASGRALFVAAALLGGRWLDRPSRPINHLGAAALALLCHDTNELFAPGFQLTFLVVLAILLLAPGLARWLLRIGAPDPFIPTALFSWPRRAWEWLRRATCELFAVALAAWVGSLPVMALVFGTVSAVSPLANVVAFPLAFATVGLGVLALAGAWAAHGWVVCLNNTNWLVAHALLGVVRAFDAVPGGSVALSDPSLWLWGERPQVEIHALDLGGRARAAHLRTHDGADWLVDVGRPWNYSRSVRPALRAYGVTSLGRRGGLILARADADHALATPLALAELAPRLLVDGLLPERSLVLRDLRRTLDPGRLREVRVRRGNEVDLAPGVAARVLYPPDDPPPSAPVTAASRALAFQVVCAGGGEDGEWRVLWLSDNTAGRGAAWLLANESPAALRSAVIVADAPVTAEFVRAAGARLVVVRSRREEGDRPLPPLALPEVPGVEFLAQEDSGAVDLRVYSGRVEARGFMDGRAVSLPR